VVAEELTRWGKDGEGMRWKKKKKKKKFTAT
jgi:hypothetical protein